MSKVRFTAFSDLDNVMRTIKKIKNDIPHRKYTIAGNIRVPSLGLCPLNNDSAVVSRLSCQAPCHKGDFALHDPSLDKAFPFICDGFCRMHMFEDNIKEDRTPEDLLFQVMLDMGVMLSSEIKTVDIQGKKVFNVNDGNLVCCFDNDLTDEVVTEIAKLQPLYAVFRDSSMSSDSVAVNFDQIFETYSPTTTRKVL